MVADSKVGRAEGGGETPDRRQGAPCVWSAEAPVLRVLAEEATPLGRGQAARGGLTWVWVGGQECGQGAFHQCTWVFLFLALKIVSQAHRAIGTSLEPDWLL